MTATATAVDRVRAFVSARDRHRGRIALFGGPTRHPLPNLIIAEYGTLDVDDLRVICDALAEISA